jgi:hypothetical protein
LFFRPSLEVDPTNPFEIAVAERLKAMQQDLDRLRARLDWLLVFIVGAALTSVVISMLK